MNSKGFKTGKPAYSNAFQYYDSRCGESNKEGKIGGRKIRRKNIYTLVYAKEEEKEEEEEEKEMRSIIKRFIKYLKKKETRVEYGYN